MAAIQPLCGLYQYCRKCLYIFICTVGKPQLKSIKDFTGLCTEVDSSINWKLFRQGCDLVGTVQKFYESHEPGKLIVKELFKNIDACSFSLPLSSLEDEI